jgi:hypothetical protein
VLASAGPVGHRPQTPGPFAWGARRPHRAIFDKTPNRLTSPARRLVIEATYPLGDFA